MCNRYEDSDQKFDGIGKRHDSIVETLAEMVRKLNGMVEKLDKVAYEVGEKLDGTEEAVEIGRWDGWREAGQDGKET